MSRVAVVAFGAVSALGEGDAAVSSGEPGEPARVAIGRDEELVRAGLHRPFAARASHVAHASGAATIDGADDRATALLARVLVACGEELDRVRPAWRGERIGLALGTSSGGMRAAEHAFAAMARGERVADVEAPTYGGPMARAARRLGHACDPAVLVLGACASAAIAIGLGTRWLELDMCDLVLAGGFDEVTVFVAAGFESLRAVTESPPPRPFRSGRDGMSLGEGAAVLALARADAAPARAYVHGFGAASDAVHLTAPDRAGDGLARAARAAIAEAAWPTVDLVSAHATATPFNDAAESRALAAALGGERAREVPVHPFKAQIGHTLGAAGALETLAAIDALVRGVLPAAAGDGPLDPEAPARLLRRAEAGSPQTALKLASAFGGANAALVIAAPRAVAPPTQRTPREAYVHRAVRVVAEPSLDELALATRTPIDRLARADALVRLALAAVAALEGTGAPLAGAGIVVGTAFATLETNALFAARIRERGAAAAEPRRFPYTSPNAVAGQCSIAFGLTGPSFAVGGGLHAGLEALATGATLVRGGDAERIVVVAVDDVGPATRALGGDALQSGAIALLVSARADSGTPLAAGVRAFGRVAAITLRRGGERVAGAPSGAPGHLALLPLVAGQAPCELLCASPPDAQARIVVAAL